MEAEKKGITITKRKAMAREMSYYQGAVAPEMVQTLCNRHHLTRAEVSGFLKSMGFHVLEVAPPRETSPVVPKPAKPAAPLHTVPQEVIAAIMSASLYKTLGEDEDDAYVVITKSRFLRERAAIQQLLKAAGFA
jgi:hypothetical protein